MDKLAVVVVTASELDAVLNSTKTLHSFTGRPGYKAGEALRFTDGTRNAQVKVAVVQVGGKDVVDIKEQTLDLVEAKAHGFADAQAFATAWDAEKRNREASKKFAAKPVVHTVRFELVAALPDTKPEEPEEPKAPKAKAKGALARKAKRKK